MMSDQKARSGLNSPSMAVLSPERESPTPMLDPSCVTMALCLTESVKPTASI